MFVRAQLAILLLAVPVWCGCDVAPLDDSVSGHPMQGEPAPLFTSTTLDDQPFELASHVGQNVVILDFWATWCGPCTRSLPTLSEVAAEYRSRGVELFAVDIGEANDEVREFLDRSGLELSVVMDPDGSISDRYGVEGIPHTVIIGRDGIVRFVHIGASPGLRGELTHVLDELTTAGG